MAVQIIEQGPRNLVIHVSGTEAGYLVDVSALAPPCQEMRLQKIQYDVAPTAGTLTVTWDATAPILAWEGHGHQGVHDFIEFGGIKNNTTAGKTGDAIIACADATATIWFKKINPVPQF